MRRTRHVIAMMVVATALCADRAIAAPQPGPQVTSFARSLASRLTVSFRQVVPSIRLVEDRREGEGICSPDSMPAEAGIPVVVHATAGSPFEFRLPPPAL